MDKAFIYDHARYLVHEETVGSGMDVTYVAFALRGNAKVSDRIFSHYWQYGRFLAQTECVEGTPVAPLISMDSPIEELQAGFQAFLKLPLPFRQFWNDARETLETGANEPELQARVSEEKKDSSAAAD